MYVRELLTILVSVLFAIAPASVTHAQQAGKVARIGVAKSRIPALWVESQWVPEGGLISYSSNLPEMPQRGAYYVDRVLRGARPSDLPVEQVSKFELRTNKRTAKTLGLTIPQQLLLLADQVVE